MILIENMMKLLTTTVMHCSVDHTRVIFVTTYVVPCLQLNGVYKLLYS